MNIVEIYELDICNRVDVCKLILLVQPSSAAAERVFSLLQKSIKQRAVTIQGKVDIYTLFNVFVRQFHIRNKKEYALDHNRQFYWE